jgi:ribonuclease P protein component
MIELRRSGTRVRSGAVTVTHLASSTAIDTPPRVAFAIGRRVGPAVARNRVRRRLRSILRDLATEPGRIPGGAYLISVQPRAVTSTFVQLTRDLERSLDKIVSSDGAAVTSGGTLVG